MSLCIDAWLAVCDTCRSCRLCLFQGRFSFYLTSQGEEATVVASAAALDPKDMVRGSSSVTYIKMSGLVGLHARFERPFMHTGTSTRSEEVLCGSYACCVRVAKRCGAMMMRSLGNLMRWLGLRRRGWSWSRESCPAAAPLPLSSRCSAICSCVSCASNVDFCAWSACSRTRTHSTAMKLQGQGA